jgi:beta-glucosidase-like glycosyl hydrolase
MAPKATPPQSFSSVNTILSRDILRGNWRWEGMIMRDCSVDMMYLIQVTQYLHIFGHDG